MSPSTGCTFSFVPQTNATSLRSLAAGWWVRGFQRLTPTAFPSLCLLLLCPLTAPGEPAAARRVSRVQLLPGRVLAADTKRPGRNSTDHLPRKHEASSAPPASCRGPQSGSRKMRATQGLAFRIPALDSPPAARFAPWVFPMKSFYGPS